MNTLFKSISLITCYAALFLSCGRTIIDPPDPEPVAGKGEMWFHFDSRYGTEDFLIDKMLPTTGTDSVAISRLSYFISNIELHNAAGQRFKEPDSYHIIQAGNTLATEEIKVKNVPPGDYIKVSFQVGIDAARNASPVEPTGDLTLLPDMKWLNSYIFMKTNGFYYDAAAPNKKAPFRYEIGHDASLRYVSLPFPVSVNVAENQKPQVHLYADLKTLFTAPNLIDIKTNPAITGEGNNNAAALKIADNYMGMFRVDHIHPH